MVVHAIGTEPHVTGRPAHRPGPEMFRGECGVHLTRGRVVVTVVCGVAIISAVILGCHVLEAALGACDGCTASEGLGGTVVTHWGVLVML